MIFLDLLKEKMAALRSSGRHRDEDWISLKIRLDQVMPQLLQAQRWARAPLLLFLLALLSSNILWWQQHRENRKAMHHIGLQLAGLKASVYSLKPFTPIVHKDTVWQTMYLRMPVQGQSGTQKLQPQNVRMAGNNPSIGGVRNIEKNILPRAIFMPYPSQQEHLDNKSDKNNPTIPAEAKFKSEPSNPGFDNMAITNSILTRLNMPPLAFLKQSAQRPSFAPDLVPLPAPKNYSRPLVPTLLNALKPQYFKVGLISGWVYPMSSSLVHQSGYEVGVQGAIGVNRHWAIIMEYTYGQLHYEASNPNSILGSPDYPIVLAPDEHFTHLNLKRQSLRQFGLGFRYSFPQLGKVNPYIGLKWGNQIIMPYSVAYEVEIEPSNTLEQGSFQVNRHTRLRNILRHSAGLEVPISSRFDFTVEGFYSGQWGKKRKGTLDMAGIRAGMNWMF